MSKLTGTSRLSHGRRAADLLRRGRQIRAIPAARLVAGRDGRSDAGLRPDPRRDDGGGRRLHAGAGRFSHSSLAGRARASSPGSAPSPPCMAALMATQQNDIKRILAYSTLSQLGYMVMAVGLASGEAAMFHLFTHAVLQGAALPRRRLDHHHAASRAKHLENGRRCAQRLPITFLTFLVGTLALIGFPGFSGFFQQRRDPRSRLRTQPADFRARRFHRVPDRVLHDAARSSSFSSGNRAARRRSMATKRPRS